MAAIYALNYVHKSGETWMNGTAVHYMLWQDRYSTAFAGWFREIEPEWFSPLATYGTLAIEASLPLLLILPFARKWCRRIAAVLILSLHLSIAALVHLGPFPYVLPLFALLVLSGEDWDPFLKRLGRRLPRLAPETDEGSPSIDRIFPARVGRALRWVRESGALAFFVLVAWEIRDDNKIFKQHLGEAWVPRAVESVTELLHLPQGWQLYTPDPPRKDFRLVIDAERMDGTHVNPVTHEPPDYDAFEHGPWHHNYLWQTYELRLVELNKEVLWIAFLKYLQRIPEIEGWDGDPRFRQIDVWVLTNERPPLGEPHSPPEKHFIARRDRRHDDIPYPDGSSAAKPKPSRPDGGVDVEDR